jgi:hypothetical protein
MANPAKEHYEALKNTIKYIAQTCSYGIYYWRDTPRTDLPDGPLPTLSSDTHVFQIDPISLTDKLYGYADSDWASCRLTRNTVSGAAIMLAGGAIGYKTKFHHAIALSSTEAEFVSVCDIGRMILYFRSILHQLQIPQTEATTIFEDNRGALFMANTKQPSPRTRYIDIKHFAIIDWVEQDHLLLQAIKTTDNCSDALTKPLTPVLHHRHFDTILGHRIPQHLQATLHSIVCRILSHDTILQTGGDDRHTYTPTLNK